MIKHLDSEKIEGKWYSVVDFYPSKAEAQKVAKAKRESGQYKSVRVVKKLADRRYAVYLVCVLYYPR